MQIVEIDAAGKTARVPPALLSLGLGQVLVLEPRRLAARLSAKGYPGDVAWRAARAACEDAPGQPERGD